MKITDKLKEAFSPEDLATLEQGINKLINEKVEEKLSMRVEEATKKIEDDAAKEAAGIIQEKIKEQMALINEQNEKKIAELEANVVEKLDQFLESEINTQISDKVLSEVALNETYKPIVENIKKLFEEQFVALDSEGHGLIREAKEEIEKKEKEQSALIAEKMDLTAQLNQVKAEKLILEKTDGLTVDQKKRVNEFFAGKELTEVESKIGSFVEMVLEHKSETAENINTNMDVISESADGLKEDETPKDKTIALANEYA
jgi:hypothetical protein